MEAWLSLLLDTSRATGLHLARKFPGKSMDQSTSGDVSLSPERQSKPIAPINGISLADKTSATAVGIAAVKCVQ